MKLLSFPELKAKKGIPYCRQHIDRRVKTGTFPPPIKLGERSNAWIEAEVDAWIEERIKASLGRRRAAGGGGPPMKRLPSLNRLSRLGAPDTARRSIPVSASLLA